MPEVEHAVLWNGQLCVPQIELNMFNPGMSRQSLIVADPKSGEVKIIPTGIPLGPVRLVAGGTALWAVTPSSVFRVQDGVATESPSRRVLTMPETAFEYRGQLAVIEEKSTVSSTGQLSVESRLLVWTGTDWQVEGQLLLPRAVADAVASDDQPAQVHFSGPTSVRAIEVNGEIHLFCTDGIELLHSSQMVVVAEGATSALAAENIETQVAGWASTGRQPEAELGVDARGLLLVENDQQFRGPSMNTHSKQFRLIDGVWTESTSWKHNGFILQHRLVSDGERALIIGQTLGDKLLVAAITEAGAPESRLSVKPGGALLERMTRTASNAGSWAVLPVLVLFAMAASWLMSAYRSSRYEFGITTVELASVTRRTLAKIIDYVLMWMPLQILQWTWFGSAAETQEWLMEQIMSGTFEFLSMIAYAVLGLVIYGLVWLIVIGVLVGVWGISPGKWVCGIRVVRTTLRPCGFFRAMARELLLFADAMMCFMWLPGACCVAFTVCWQRLGDLVSDTIVIRRPVDEVEPIPLTIASE
ncbi:MAG: RDD family protein [Candidatus Saccharimonas sp.]|nr:RDD family protein [Planctomycetaceae bacterium]